MGSHLWWEVYGDTKIKKGKDAEAKKERVDKNMDKARGVVASIVGSSSALQDKWQDHYLVIWWLSSLDDAAANGNYSFLQGYFGDTASDAMSWAVLGKEAKAMSRLKWMKPEYFEYMS